MKVGFRDGGRGRVSAFQNSGNFEIGVTVWFRSRGQDTRHGLGSGFETGVRVEFRDSGKGLVSERESGWDFRTRARSGLGTGSGSGFWIGVRVDF